MNRRRIEGMAAVAVLLPSLTGCGYRVGGRADLLPKTIRTIAVPAFANATIRYKVSDRLASAITREFLTRTRYNVVADPNQADAVLNGTVVSFATYPTIFDPGSGRASGVQVVLTMQIALTDRATKQFLFNRPSLQFRERYEISVDQESYFDESDLALDRLSRDVARSVVSAILENF